MSFSDRKPPFNPIGNCGCLVIGGVLLAIEAVLLFAVSFPYQNSASKTEMIIRFVMFPGSLFITIPLAVFLGLKMQSDDEA